MSRQRTSRRRDRRDKQQAIKKIEVSQPTHDIPIYELLSEEGTELIHQKSMEILAEVGIDFYLDEARDILKKNGVKMQGDTAYFEPGQVQEYVAKAPSQFTQLARNPENNVVIGGNNMVFAPVYGPPFVYDQKRGRRAATLEDFQNFVKLAYMSPYMHHSGGTIVEPSDEHEATRHLDMLFSHIKYSDKPFMGSVMSRENAEDSVKMVEKVFGEDAIRENPALISLINISSPRRLDDRMLDALTVYARARQATIITPFIMAGAMSPVSLAGTLIQQNAEALAGIAYAQMVEPGTPVVYGSFMTNVDLKSGAPVFGSPESQMAIFTSAQMARRYNLPFRSGGMFASSKISDAQSAYESVMTMLPTVLGRVNFVLHAAGWLENGLAAGYEKFVLDCELLGMYHTLLKGMDLSEDAWAMDSLRDVPPGGHHLGTEHTMRHFTTAFYRAELFDYKDVDTWVEEGSTTASERAYKKVQELLSNYEAPELDPDTEEALQEFITKRKKEISK
ncbi:MAG TPA: trimethylamine methyltransferase family protein [Anaerolineales bacterium]|nr:trimethylamine methyltransferase family protein [Anaerolineales bacterium]